MKKLFKNRAKDVGGVSLDKILSVNANTVGLVYIIYAQYIILVVQKDK
jgi:hypothetical protein